MYEKGKILIIFFFKFHIFHAFYDKNETDSVNRTVRVVAIYAKMTLPDSQRKPLFIDNVK